MSSHSRILTVPALCLMHDSRDCLLQKKTEVGSPFADDSFVGFIYEIVDLVLTLGWLSKPHHQSARVRDRWLAAATYSLIINSITPPKSKIPFSKP
ncbi:predicted protein [Sclerotinia sclerotiorum 1980 UF-70]|uniref:Uncharacterized protein n=1 Tax=Sclerotinia sclerotiorum (strain ATCC 18683 / 1980 / Ss-1) TaxID=665079 RepID=A7EUK5_SCLS1|nr:predicted protein [Sclerotinia sclerotiorum 1980 UF-70]EDN93147.1 predicted protein [Sclerotinia sclerotiorum 1980 UF-70]